MLHTSYLLPDLAKMARAYLTARILCLGNIPSGGIQRRRDIDGSSRPRPYIELCGLKYRTDDTQIMETVYLTP